VHGPLGGVTEVARARTVGEAAGVERGAGGARSAADEKDSACHGEVFWNAGDGGRSSP